MKVQVVIGILLLVSFLNREHLFSPSHHQPRSYPASLSLRIKGFILTYNKQLPEREAEEMANLIILSSQRARLDPCLLTALIARESRFNPQAVSSSGALGLGQLMPGTAKEVGVEDPFDSEQNIRGTADYLRKMFDAWEGYSNQLDLALASYRLGCGTVRNYGGIPPILDVQEYIKSVKELAKRI